MVHQNLTGEEARLSFPARVVHGALSVCTTDWVRLQKVRAHRVVEGGLRAAGQELALTAVL